MEAAAVPAVLSTPKARPYSIAPTTFDEAVRFAELVAKSAFCPKEYRGRAHDILVAVEMGAEVGFRPMQALQSISVINGRPAIYGDGAIALVRATGELEDFDEHFDGEGENLTAVCMTKRKGDRSPVIRRFSVAMAKRARLWGKQGPWTEYPQRMLQMRARSWALRDGWADVLRGLHIWEEVEDTVETEPTTVATATAGVHERLREKYGVGEPVPEAPPADTAPEPPPESENE